MRRKSQLDEEQERLDAVETGIKELLQDLSSATVDAINDVTARAGAMGIVGDTLDAAATRKTHLEEQAKVRLKLLRANIIEDVLEIERLIAEVSAEGFDDDSKW